ncbi:MAG: hypothetical protein ABL953_06740 [Ilumatobacteraceae bacterium]
MRSPRALILAALLVLGACSDDNHDGENTPSTDTSDTVDSQPVDASNACALLSPNDFAVVGFTVDDDGVDVSENFTLATTSSVACQWTNFDDNVGGSWELIIGIGDAEAAYEFEVSFAQLDTFTTLDIGDEAYLADKVSSFDADDHDYEAGVRVSDTFFTLSTTDDRGAEAIVALATLIADRLTS